MNKATLLACACIFLATVPAVGIAKIDYSQRNISVGQKFSVSFDSISGTPVQWYVLEPLGPGIKFLDAKDESSAQRGRAGGPSIRTFTFEAIQSTEGAVYFIPFVQIDVTKVGSANMCVASKEVSYSVAHK